MPFPEAILKTKEKIVGFCKLLQSFKKYFPSVLTQRRENANNCRKFPRALEVGLITALLILQRYEIRFLGSISKILLTMFSAPVLYRAEDRSHLVTSGRRKFGISVNECCDLAEV